MFFWVAKKALHKFQTYSLKARKSDVVDENQI